MIRAVLDTVQIAGDHVVTLAQNTAGDSGLTALVDRGGYEFERLLMVVGDDLYEFRPSLEGNPSTPVIVEIAGTQ